MKLLFLSLVLTAAALCAQVPSLPQRDSLPPGSRMPEISAQWINEPVRKTPGEKQKQITVLTLVDILSPNIFQTLRMIESLEKKYALETRGVVTLETVARNDLNLVKKILKSNDSPFVLAIGVDDKGRTFKRFDTTVGTLPFTIIAQNGAIVWKGHPVEIETVTDAILADEFSLSRQKKITALRQQLQSALKAGLPDVVAQTAEKILAIAPLDTIAMQARLYAFEQKGQTAEEARFLAEHIRRHPANSLQMRMLLLDLLQRLDDGAAWNKTVAETVAEAAKKPEDALNFAAYLLDRSAMANMPIQAILSLSDSAVRSFQSSPRQDMYADALEIAARTQYAACRLDPAIDLQKKAVAVREKSRSPFLNRSRKSLAFFESLKTLK